MEPITNLTAANTIETKQATAEKNKFNQELTGAAQDFDALLIQNLLNEMNKFEGDSLFGNSFAGEIYKDLFNQELAKKLAKSENIGFSKMVIEHYYKK